MKKKENESGYTLVESLAFIAIISIVAISIISVISHMLDRYKNSRLTGQVVELQRAINTRFAAAEDYSKLTSKLLKDENLAPGDMNWSGDTMIHKYGGNVTLRPAYSNHAYDVIFEDLPHNACTELATQNWARDQYSSLMYMRVNGTTLNWKGSKADPYAMPISNATANSLCNASKDKNKIQWRFQ